MSDGMYAGIVSLGFMLLALPALGLLLGWLAWRLPMLHAEQRGREMAEDGVCICGRPLHDKAGTGGAQA